LGERNFQDDGGWYDKQKENPTKPRRHMEPHRSTSGRGAEKGVPPRSITPGPNRKEDRNKTGGNSLLRKRVPNVFARVECS